MNTRHTYPYFLQYFESITTVCLIINVFCKSCEPDNFQPVLPLLQIKTKTISCSQILQNACIVNFEENIDLLPHIHLAAHTHCEYICVIITEDRLEKLQK